ncbi:flippase [Rhodococcus sp. CX]|uniref:flippase n=1 Tax=Rhodococcus sp. CX TaxID=2789880 RepID=UPI0018CC81D6|nr:flippase [Rhodococcus sp. CX]MBH0122999.1 flippase [Rhodococcus sp. CX]
MNTVDAEAANPATKMRRIRDRLRDGAASNGIWASLQQVCNLLFVGLLSVILARTLPVEDFGVYSYAMSLAGLGIAIGLAGLYGLAIKRYSESREPGTVTCSIIIVREATVAFYFVALLGFMGSTATSVDEFLLVALAAVAVFGRVLDAPELWYQARLNARKPALAKIIVAAVFFAAKCTALWLGSGVTVIVALYVAELFAGSVAVLVCYRRDVTSGRAFAVPGARDVVDLWKRSSPLLISGIAQQVNLRASLIVVQILVGATGVAMFAVSQRVMDVCLALPMAYMTATFPALLEARRKDRDSGGGSAYRDRLQRSFDGALWAGIAIAVLLYVLADVVVVTAFGAEYEDAAALLRIQALAVPFMFMSSVLSKWIIAEGNLWISVGRHWLGAVATVALCLLLVPKWGAVGAAWASTASYVMSVYLFTFLSRSTWPVAVQMSRAWMAPVSRVLARAGSQRVES